MDNVTRADALIQYTNKKGADIEDWDEILPINLLVYDEATNIIKKGNGAYTFSTLPIWLNLAELENLSNIGNYIEKNIFIDDNIDKLLIITKEGSIGISDVLTNTTLAMLLANINTILEIGGGVNIRPPIIIGKQRKNINTTLELEAVSFTAYAGEKLIDYNWTLPDDSIVPGKTLSYPIPDDVGLLGTTLTFKCKAVSHEFDFISKFSTHDVMVAADEDGAITDVEFYIPVPIINSITWDPLGDHDENNAYAMTIDATDPQALDLTYGVICDDPTVGIVQRVDPNEHIFDITYGEYAVNTDLTYTITVTNTDLLSTNQDELITVHDIVVSNERGVFAGGTDGNYLNTIEFIIISVEGNVTDFGDLSVIKQDLAATSNGANDRGIFGGGYNGNSISTIEYITISTEGDVTPFGSLSADRRQLAATSNGTNERGIFGGGWDGANRFDIIEYVTISTEGNVINFGDLSAVKSLLVATSNGTNERGVFAGGADSFRLSDIEYVTISTEGNVTHFGSLSLGKSNLAATSNGTGDRGIFGGGYSTGRIDTIEYITISSIGNTTDFGDLSEVNNSLSATSNGTGDRGIFAGGHNNSIHLNIIEYITISSGSGVTDFGDLSTWKSLLVATSNA